MSDKNKLNEIIDENKQDDYVMVKSSDYKNMMVTLLGDNKLLNEKLNEYKNIFKQMGEKLDDFNRKKEENNVSNVKQIGGSIKSQKNIIQKT